MLVLSRKVGEKVYIGDGICVTVVNIEGNKIRLGFEAPESVPIYRQELLPPGVAPPAALPAVARRRVAATGVRKTAEGEYHLVLAASGVPGEIAVAVGRDVAATVARILGVELE